jgi:hypothetical protein
LFCTRKERSMPPVLRTTVILLAITFTLIVLPTPASRAADPPTTQLFNLTVSLEWDPGRQDTPNSRWTATQTATGCSADAKATYLADLQAGLTDASRYLYAYSRGRFALGNITIDTEGSRWASADIRVLANGSYRPTAEVGGVVIAPTRNISATTGVSVSFYPGAVTLGRQWNGLGARCGAWSQPEAWRTIGHEWGHYALFLWDEYYEQFGLREQYCTTTGFGLLSPRRGDRASASVDGAANSVMAYHYTADRLWESGSASSCEQTPQQRVNATSDWETIRRFYPSIGTPDSIPTAPAPTPTFTIAAAAPSEYTSALIKAEQLSDPHDVAQAYLVRSSGGLPIRIIGQGELLQSESSVILGARPSLGDRALIMSENWPSGTRRVFPANASTTTALDTTPGATPAALQLADQIWRPAVRITPIVVQLTSDTSNLAGLRLQIEDCNRQTKQIQVVLCPAGGACSNPLTLNVGSGGIFSGSISLPDEIASRQSASLGYLYLHGIETNEEIISSYQIGGGAGSGHIGAHPPLMDGAVGIETPGTNLPLGRDVRVASSTALVCQAPTLPAGIRRIIGNPVDVQPVFADGNGGQPWGSQVGDPPLSVRLSYSQDLIDRLGIDERSLVLLRLNAQGVWQVVPSSGSSAALDWIAGTPEALKGNGAVYVLAAADARVSLPLVVR